MDLNGDSFNDVVTVDSTFKWFWIHLFDSVSYVYKNDYVYTLSWKECNITTLNFISGVTLTAIYTCGEDPTQYYMAYSELKPLIPPAENKTEPVNNTTDPEPINNTTDPDP